MFLYHGLSFLTTVFNIPGYFPRTYNTTSQIPLYLNKIRSEVTQIPYEYTSLPFVCKPSAPVYRTLNIGQVLRGNRMTTSDYKARNPLPKNSNRKSCSFEKTLNVGSCVKLKWTQSHLWTGIFAVCMAIYIRTLDDLPVATRYISTDQGRNISRIPGFPLGAREKEGEKKALFLYNHIDLVIYYQPASPVSLELVIIGVEGIPRSTNITNGRCPSLVPLNTLSTLDIFNQTGEINEITYTYSVFWKLEQSLQWSERWNPYLIDSNPTIHWLGFINNAIIVLFLSLLVALVMIRTLRQDIQIDHSRNDGNNEDDLSGWKLLHGDVFRPPGLAGLFAPIIGTGIQILITLVTLLCMTPGLWDVSVLTFAG
ncbi:Transmembrane 9 superfamily member 4 [Neolecta irregularis DAH-3]|uniref:Transmembrane 9 superfamily member n=1 Tax=Neolecta irregularis (strain DAH-3) TaxID=1198029 RepID=A0A1U7LTL7_NEOID|nr:Transmembrane 9 superfamily member 4 [Neolecta irregularis DAH-3]|eukprot:OLL25861.1 Transmembrane 9 superfamily member 4 [Neolecta irregularis DAH-3]